MSAAVIVTHQNVLAAADPQYTTLVDLKAIASGVMDNGRPWQHFYDCFQRLSADDRHTLRLVIGAHL